MKSTDQYNQQIINSLPCWTSAITLSTLDGGITNHNYLVVDDTKKYVVRLGADIPVHQIMRFNEIAAATAAHAAGLSPQIRHHQDGVLVMDYIDSTALTDKQVQNKHTLEQVINLVKRCHQQIPGHLRGASLVFWVFHVVRNYAATLRDGNSRYADSLPQLLLDAEQLENTAGPYDLVFGHNDLLPANILDDGNRLWLIDWEYAGFNTPLFDLGGLASNSSLNTASEQTMLEHYFEKPLTDSLWQQYSAMKCASLLRETLWSMVSEIHSDLDFDYAVYTRENLTRYQHALNEFKQL